MTYHKTVCYYHVTYAFQSELTLYIFLNIKELLAWNKSHIWILSYYNGTRTHNHLVCKWTRNNLAILVSLAKQLSVRLRTKWLWIRVPLTPVSSKELLEIQANIECRFILKHVRDMTITYSQMHRTDKYSQHSSII